jgi:hypothetical protein
VPNRAATATATIAATFVSTDRTVAATARLRC